MSDAKAFNYGIEESKQVIDFVGSLGVAIGKSLEDKTISFADAPNFIPALMKAIPALEGIDLVSLEFMDMTPDEATELKAYAKAQFDLSDDKTEDFVEDAFAIALAIFMFVKTNFIKSQNEPTQPTN